MDLLDEMNSIIVTPDELDSILEEGEEWVKGGKGDSGAGLFLIANRYRPDFNRAFAVHVRIGCLIEMLNSEKAKGWTLPTQSDGIPVREEMISVAATHPIIRIDNRFAFDEVSFFAKVLETTASVGSGGAS